MGDLERKRVGEAPSELRSATRAGRGSPVEMQGHGVPGRRKGEGGGTHSSGRTAWHLPGGKEADATDPSEQAGGGWQIEVREVTGQIAEF